MDQARFNVELSSSFLPHDASLVQLLIGTKLKGQAWPKSGHKHP